MGSVAVEKAFCTTTEAAALLGISVGTVQLWVESGVLEAWKTAGGHRRVLRHSIDRLLRRPFEPAEKTEQELLTPGDPAKLNVLVVEDDPNLLRLYEANISRWPGKPEVMTLRNAFTALIRIGRSKPDLLILDLQMPGIDGFTVLNHAIKRNPAIIKIVDGWATRLDAKRATALGFTAEATFEEIIRVHIEDELGGKIA